MEYGDLEKPQALFVYVNDTLMLILSPNFLAEDFFLKNCQRTPRYGTKPDTISWLGSKRPKVEEAKISHILQTTDFWLWV